MELLTKVHATILKELDDLKKKKKNSTFIFLNKTYAISNIAQAGPKHLRSETTIA